MHYLKEIERYQPQNTQEASDKRLILECIARSPHDVLTRENLAAHITSSSFLVNESCDKALLVHHNIMGKWAWTGGHADGDEDLLAVALREAREETGVATIRPLREEIASLDVLHVYGHVRRREYVSAHLHLSVSYLLMCSESEALFAKDGENTAVMWFPFSYFTSAHFDAWDVYLYNKLIERARAAYEAGASWLCRG